MHICLLYLYDLCSLIAPPNKIWKGLHMQSSLTLTNHPVSKKNWVFSNWLLDMYSVCLLWKHMLIIVYLVESSLCKVIHPCLLNEATRETVNNSNCRRRYMAEILPIRCKRQFNQSINLIDNALSLALFCWIFLSRFFHVLKLNRLLHFKEP